MLYYLANDSMPALVFDRERVKLFQLINLFIEVYHTTRIFALFTVYSIREYNLIKQFRLSAPIAAAAPCNIFADVHVFSNCFSTVFEHYF